MQPHPNLIYDDEGNTIAALTGETIPLTYRPQANIQCPRCRSDEEAKPHHHYGQGITLSAWQRRNDAWRKSCRQI